MAKIEVTKTELVWPGKYNEDGSRKAAPRVSLPFQVIQTVNESRASREAKKAPQMTLFDIYQGKEGETFEEDWRNKLIWGDNLLVMGSLLEKFAGKIDLIYIDPPFATGADFSFSVPIGDSELEVTKEQSIIEEKAYRDTWGRGLDSYLQMLYERMLLMRDLLSETGSIYVHIGPRIGCWIKVLLEDTLGSAGPSTEICWKRVTGHGDSKRWGVVHDLLIWHPKSDRFLCNPQYEA
jgi:adenine-specific DNA-methyltransferase